MSRLVCCFVLILARGVTAGQAPPSPVAWSPDGRWLAFVEEDAPGGASRADLLFPGASQLPREDLRSQFRLWAVRADDLAAALLEESTREIGPPAWRPDGEAIGYCRETPAGGYEVVIREGGSKTRIIARFPPARAAAERRSALSVAWSADGGRLAVERPEPAGLVLLDVASGKERAFIPRGILPSWHPTGREIAYYRWESPASVVACRADADAGHERVLMHVSSPSQPPVWALGGRSLLIVDCPRSPDGSAQAVLLDLGQPEGRPAPLKAIENPLLPMQRLSGCWLAVDAAGVQQFYSVLVDGRDNAISHHRGAAVLDRFAPIDEAIPLSSLALAPGGDRLAVRAGEIGPRGTVAVIGLPDKKLTPLLPGPEARSAWRRELLRTILQRFASGEEGLAGNPVELPTVFPIVAAGEGEPRLPARILRLAEVLARVGSGRPATAGPTFEDRLAALVIAYAKGDFDESLRLLDPIESAISDPDQRLRMLGLRAQIEAMGGQARPAAARLEYLAELFPESPEVPRGEGSAFDVISHGQEHSEWIRTLRTRLFDDKMPGGAPADDPFAPINPGASVPRM